MQIDIYGQQILDEMDLCSAFLSNPNIKIKNALVSDDIYFDKDLEIVNIPTFKKYVKQSLSKEEFDKQLQCNWFIPEEYNQLDIAKYVLDLCKTNAELQRVGQELILYQQRELFPLLRYCKYLVDTMRKHNVVWGVGRGSSVSSYVLFLLGIHRINSLHYDLSIDEFLK
jgi:DNA polymerase III alpha subunit